MKIEQYLAHTDYALWEVILNGVSIEDANQRFLRSLPSAWSNISLIMRNKPGIDNLNIDDMYNNLKVYEADIKGSSGSSSNSLNVAFVSAESTNSTNELNAAYSVSTATGHSSQAQDDLEEMGLKWQVVMLSMRVKRFYKKTGRKLKFNRKEPVGFDKTKVECFNCHRRGHFARDCRSAKNSGNKKEEATNFALMAFTSNPSSSSSSNSELNEKEVLDVKKEEVTETVFDNRSSDEENSLANDRFKKGEGYHAVPPPLTRNYMPPKSNLSFVGLDDSIYEFKISKTVTSLTKNEKDTPETSTTCVEKPKEDRSSDPLIQDWDTDSESDNVFRPEHIPAKTDFVKAVFTRSGRIPISAAKTKVAASTSAAKPVNIAGSKQSVHFSKSRSTSHKSHSPIRRSFYNATTHSRRNSTERVNTAGSKAVSVVKENRVTAVKTSTGCVWRPRVNDIDQISKDNRWIYTCVDYGHPQQALKNKGIVDSGCSRHMIENKAYLADYQVISDGGFVAFGSSRGKITSKASIDESNLWHRRLGYVNFKTMNKLVKGNLVRGLPSKIFENNHTCVACQKGNSTKPHAEAVNTACYVLNRALVTKSQNKTPYELLNGRTPRIDFMRPFGYPVTILNTLDPLGKFEGKADEGFLVGYSVTSKAFRVFNTKLEKLKRIGTLVSAGNQSDKNAGPQDSNGNAGTQDNVDVGKEVSDQHYIMLPLWSSISSTFKSLNDKAADDKPKDDTDSKTVEESVNKEDQDYRDELDRLMGQEKEASKAADALRKEFELGCMDQRGATKAGSTNSFNTVSNLVNVASTLGTFSAGGPSSPHPDALIPANTLLHVDQDDSQILDLEDTAELKKAAFNNMDSSIVVNPIPTHRMHIDHPKDQILGYPKSAVQTRGMAKKTSGAHALLEPKKVAQALDDESWVEAMQEELLQFSLLKVWRLVDLTYGKTAIKTKWVYRNKKDKRGIVVRNKARLVAQGHRHEEETDYDEVFAPVAKIAAIKIFLAFASFMGFIVYQVDVKSAFLYGTIEDEVYVSQPPGFIDPLFPNKVYKVYVDDIIFGSTKMSLCDEFEALMHKRLSMSSMKELTFFLGLQVKQSEEGIFISQDKYVAEILKKFDFSSVKTDSTPIETQKPLVKDEEAADADVYLYRSMIGSLMYLTASRPDIMFEVCACSRFQVNPKLSHLHAVKRIFRYLKGQPKLGLWYPRDSLFDLEAYSDSDYAGANLDKKFITREYVVTTNCCGQVKEYQEKDKIESKPDKNGKREGSGSGPGRQETIGGVMAQIRSEGALIQSIDPPLSTGYTVRSGENRMKHDIELMDHVPQTPHDSPLSGGHTPRSDEGFHSFRAGSSKRHSFGRRKVSKQERKNLKSQQMFQDIDDVLDEDMKNQKAKEKTIAFKDADDSARPIRSITTLQPLPTIDLKDKENGSRPNISDARPKVNTAEPKTPPTTTTLFDDEDVTIADTLVKMKNQKAKEKIIAFKDADDSARPIRSITTLQPLPTIDLKHKDLNEKAITERERQEEASKAALGKMYDEVQAQIDVDHELAVRLTLEEQEKYIVEERSKLLAKIFERRKKRLAKERTEAIRSKPPIKTQLRNLMMTYLKHTGSEEDEKRIGRRKKRATCSSLKHKSPKKQKVNDQESKDNDIEHRKCLKVVPDDDKAIDYKTLDVKSPIVDCESQLLGTNEADDVHVYKLTRLYGSYRHFLTFSRMLEVLDRQDVLDLHKIIMERFLANDPEGFFLIDRWAILDAMVWRHPDTAIDDPRPAASSFSMADVRQLSAHVIKPRDMPEGVLVLSGLSHVWKSRVCDLVLQGADGNVMGIHDFLCLPEWTGAQVQEEPYLDIRPTLQRFPFYCTPHAMADASTSGATSSHVTKRTRSAFAESSGSTTRPSLFVGDSYDESDGDDDACVKIPLVTPLHSASLPQETMVGALLLLMLKVLTPEGKGIMANDGAAPSVGVSRPRPSFGPVPSFRDVPGDVIRADFFLFLLVHIMPRILKMALLRIESLLMRTLSEDQLIAKISVLHCMMMSHGGELLARYRGFLQSYHEYVQSADSRLKGYEEKVAGAAGLELQVSTLKKQVLGLNDKLASSDDSFSKSKAKGKERKKNIKSLTKSLDNLHAEVARLSSALNQPIVQGELLSLVASAGFERGLSMRWSKDEFATVLKKMVNFMPGAQDRLAEASPFLKNWLIRPTPPSRDARVSPPTTKELNVTPASKSLELPANVDLTTFVVTYEHNKEMVNAEVDGYDLKMTELVEVGSRCASFGPNDVVVAFSAGEKGDGLVPSYAAGEGRVVRRRTLVAPSLGQTDCRYVVVHPVDLESCHPP
uniref:Ribonuclease H-like domain-containing protein n=1 Tax=Tanacetum cinerariifolium TaxID=118510 RepID=A0A6L2N3J5_TANCI|nr:ribonuclease H-like domain-containing protein [Tanacetum cinerariifolium]